MTCTARTQAQAHELADSLELVGCVHGVAVLAPSVGPRAGWTIEATLARATVPPEVVRVLVRHESELVDVSTRGEPVRAVVTIQV